MASADTGSAGAGSCRIGFSFSKTRGAQFMTSNPSPDAKQGTISLGDEEAVRQVLVSTVLGLWDIVNNLSRLRPSKHERYRVSIFGSARAQPGTHVYAEVKRAAAALAALGCDII